MKQFVAICAALTLIVPPVPAMARSIMVDICGAPGVRLVLSFQMPLPQKGEGHSCCKKGCHATSERKKRLTNATDDIGDDGCC